MTNIPNRIGIATVWTRSSAFCRGSMAARRVTTKPAGEDQCPEAGTGRACDIGVAEEGERHGAAETDADQAQRDRCDGRPREEQ
jgi:hypothetical protein